MVQAGRGFPSTYTYYRHFGSLKNLYRLLQYEPPKGTFGKVEPRRRTIHFHSKIIDRIRSLFPDHVEVVRPRNCCRPILRLDGRFLVSIAISSSGCRLTGTIRWITLTPQSERANITLVARLNTSNADFLDFWVLPEGHVKHHHESSEYDPWLVRGTQLEDLNDFYKTIIEMEQKKHAGSHVPSGRTGSRKEDILQSRLHRRRESGDRQSSRRRGAQD
jgi:hypothetical protein